MTRPPGSCRRDRSLEISATPNSSPTSRTGSANATRPTKRVRKHQRRCLPTATPHRSTSRRSRKDSPRGHRQQRHALRDSELLLGQEPNATRKNNNAEYEPETRRTFRPERPAKDHPRGCVGGAQPRLSLPLGRQPVHRARR